MYTARTIHFSITGGKKLYGEVTVDTSKNGAMGLIAASLLNTAPTTLRNVPKIEEVYRLVEVMESIGVSAVWEKKDLTLVPPEQYDLSKLNEDAARKTRSIIMFMGPLLHHLQSFSIPHSGGCRLGSRTVRPHFFALEKLGVTVDTKDGWWHVSHAGLHTAEVIMYESSDTATENILMAASRIPGKTTIKYASANYQVQELCFFLEQCGVRIDGVGTTTLVVHGKKRINTPVVYELSEDPIVAMFYLAAAVTTRSSITIKRMPIDFLEQELLVLEKMGFKYDVLRHYVSRNKHTRLIDIKTHASELVALDDKIHARPYPGLNMDNLPFFAVIATQAKGTTLIHDWMYEKRAIYLTELDKLGAETMLADPHRIYIEGPTTLHPAELMSPPALRPAVVLLVAMLSASGHSTLRNVYPINRGYEDIAGKLRSLGAEIEVMEERC
ncbi:MAG: UDP-N-acetylglucosamine 1-carboxyvinyltransferase [Candidatus Pacebacteria bacterium]|nr:UDP-N-acetylglucosamine 1-carboxyvinyltransferase [Candidatus Paceibacterota bacterium]